jgi:hypothetical protein
MSENAKRSGYSFTSVFTKRPVTSCKESPGQRMSRRSHILKIDQVRDRLEWLSIPHCLADYMRKENPMVGILWPRTLCNEPQPPASRHQQNSPDDQDVRPDSQQIQDDECTVRSQECHAYGPWNGAHREPQQETKPAVSGGNDG